MAAASTKLPPPPLLWAAGRGHRRSGGAHPEPAGARPARPALRRRRLRRRGTRSGSGRPATGPVAAGIGALGAAHARRGDGSRLTPQPRHGRQVPGASTGPHAAVVFSHEDL